MPRRSFEVLLIKPSKYDDDGYVIRVANGEPGREGIADILANSAARTADVVMSRLGPEDGLDVATHD